MYAISNYMWLIFMVNQLVKIPVPWMLRAKNMFKYSWWHVRMFSQIHLQKVVILFVDLHQKSLPPTYHEIIPHQLYAGGVLMGKILTSTRWFIQAVTFSSHMWRARISPLISGHLTSLNHPKKVRFADLPGTFYSGVKSSSNSLGGADVENPGSATTVVSNLLRSHIIEHSVG